MLFEFIKIHLCFNLFGLGIGCIIHFIHSIILDQPMIKIQDNNNEEIIIPTCILPIIFCIIAPYILPYYLYLFLFFNRFAMKARLVLYTLCHNFYVYRYKFRYQKYDNNCPVCLDETDERLKCGHLTHSECLIEDYCLLCMQPQYTTLKKVEKKYYLKQ